MLVMVFLNHAFSTSCISIRITNTLDKERTRGLFPYKTIHPLLDLNRIWNISVILQIFRFFVFVLILFLFITLFYVLQLTLSNSIFKNQKILFEILKYSNSREYFIPHFQMKEPPPTLLIELQKDQERF